MAEMDDLGEEAGALHNLPNLTSHHKVLVGVDGSGPSHKALLWAASEAGMRASELVILHAWEFPGLPYGAYPTEAEDLESGAKAILSEAEELVKRHFPALSCSVVLAEGNAAAAIRELQDTVDLVVIGSHGHGALSSLVLGSLSTQLGHNCTAPLVIVHGQLTS